MATLATQLAPPQARWSPSAPRNLPLLVVVMLAGCGMLGVSGWSSPPCGAFLQGRHGFFHSPNFPQRFPTPLLCRWVIHAQPNEKIILYFTQYYLRDSFHLFEYMSYEGPHNNSGEHHLGEISFQDEIRYVVAYRPYVVVTFSVHTIGNMHLRVDEHLMDVYGFNITYDIVPRDQEVRKDSCSAPECSYLGNCVVSADYLHYSCDCFDGFFGDECEYGPYCDPAKGINSCENGGQCRYFYGSLVNTCECPPGFEGIRCEILQTHNKACEKRGCSQSCQMDEDSQIYCVCYSGYKLHSDNVTCIEKEIFVVSVVVEIFQIPLRLPQATLNNHLNRFANQMRGLLEGVSNITIELFDQGHISRAAPWYLWHFKVLVERQQKDALVDLIPLLLRRGACHPPKFSNVSRCGSINLTADPEMKLLTVENYDHRPALEGKLLTIACSARGSANLQFQWLKNGSPINITWPERNMWEVRIPPTIENRQMSVINIDDVTIYDRGTFTCVISDAGKQQNKSVVVDVITLPLVELTPPSATLEPGGTVYIRCLSPEDTKRAFSYEWLVNGAEVGSADPDFFIEDLFPTGLMLGIRATPPKTNFTCRVGNLAGFSSLSATVFVIPENTSLGFCPRQIGKNGVLKWEKTFDGNYDIQNCPVDTGDMIISRSGNGYSRRYCSCDEAGGCVWAEPNLARCQSGRLIEIYDELERLLLGYQGNTSASIYDSLYRLIRRARSKLIAGDVDFTAVILHSFVHSMRQHPFLAPSSGLFGLESMVDFMNILLEEGLGSNMDEIRDMYVGMRLLHIARIVSEMELGRRVLARGPVVQGKIGVELREVTVNSSVRKPEVKIGVAQNDTGQRYTRGAGEDPSHLETAVEKLPAYEFTIRSIYPLLRVQGSERPELVSDLVIVHPAVNMEVPVLLEPVTVLLQHTADTGPVTGENETVCLRWEDVKVSSSAAFTPVTARSIGHGSLTGRWTTEGCHVLNMTLTFTACSCPCPGIYSLTMQPRQIPVDPQVQRSYDAVLLVGCSISALVLLAALVIHVVTCRAVRKRHHLSPFQKTGSSAEESTIDVQFDWRDMIGNHHFIHLNLILCFCAVNVMSLLCLLQYDQPVMCNSGKLVLQFFYLGAFAFLFLKAIQVFVDTNNVKRLDKGCLKYCLVGWGIPAIITGAVAVGSEIIGRGSFCGKWCLFTELHWQFYAFLISALSLVLVQTGLQIFCFVRIMKWENEDRFIDRRKHLATMALCLTCSVLLSIMVVLGSLANTRDTSAFSWIFTLADLLLTVLTVVFFCYLNHQVLHALRSFIRRDMPQRRSSSSFRAYMMPEKVEKKPQSPEQSIQKYYEEMDRVKYTAEHKRKLRFLLGSSSGGEEVVQPLAIAEELREEEQGAHGGHAHGQDFVVDSGISEGTESDRSSFKHNMEPESQSGPSSVEKDCDVRYLNYFECSRV